MNDPPFSELCERNDKKLFLKVTANDEHILHQLLPEIGDRVIICVIVKRNLNYLAKIVTKQNVIS